MAGASLLTACGLFGPAPTPTATRVPTPTVPPPTPTATPEPLAATVNGRPITLAVYEQEVQRCEAGKHSAGLDASDCRTVVLQSLIDQAIVEQTAEAAGLKVSDEELEAARTRIVESLGGPEAYTAWLAANLYTDDEYRDALRRDMLRARMAEQAAAQVNDRAEQVHARQLLVSDVITAESLLEQIRTGGDFDKLAQAYSIDESSRAAGGDLGWFPRGLLTTPEVEQAAFNLQPGETSNVIHSALGYHIVQTLERQPARPLSPNAWQTLRARAYQAWLEHLLAQADVRKLVTP